MPHPKIRKSRPKSEAPHRPAADSLSAADRRRAGAIAALVLPWYDQAHRRLPWRVPPADLAGGRQPDPYRVWLSEIMLQQTTVAAVIPYFLHFTRTWPRVADLATAPVDDVMAAWAGLGYYARARNLQACAKIVAEDYGGRFPDSAAALRALPGIGPYTAAAIAAIAFNEAAAVLDGNVERVLSRVFAETTPLPRSKPRLRQLAEAATPRARPGDFAQGMMDLGATVCTPGRPDCPACPLRQLCLGLAGGMAAELPRRQPKADRPERFTVAYLITRPDGAVYFRRRPPKGLLGGMLEIPSSDWRSKPWSMAEARSAAPLEAKWQEASGGARHVFTHFSLSITALEARLSARAAAKLTGEWLQPGKAALPTVMKKMLALRAA